MTIPFNKPFIAGKELHYIAQAVAFGNIGADGVFTKKCERILEKEFELHRALMTPSCTAALEMASRKAKLLRGVLEKLRKSQGGRFELKGKTCRTME